MGRGGSGSSKAEHRGSGTRTFDSALQVPKEVNTLGLLAAYPKQLMK
jgi:hypothetical protein